jgi:hypothetical protein
MGIELDKMAFTAEVKEKKLDLGFAIGESFAGPFAGAVTGPIKKKFFDLTGGI